MWLDYLILGLYALSMVFIALYTRKKAKSVNDFMFAGKKGLNGWMSAFSYGTTYFSAVIFIGYAGKFGSSFGLSAVWIGVGNAIFGSFVAWRLMAKRTKNMTQRLSAKTMPEFFEKRYDSKSLKLVTAIIIFVFLVPYSASVYNGLGGLFKIVFGINNTWVIMVGLAVLTALYLVFGGYFATALTDFIQGIIMLIGIIAMVACFMNSSQVGWDLSKLTSDVNKTWFTFNSTKTGIYGSTVSLLALILLTSMGVYGLPQTVHKYYAVRDKKAIMQGTIVSTVFALIIGFGAYFTGALSGLFGLGDIHSDSIVPTMISLVIPSGLIGIITVLMLSASMSTLASVSLSSASVVAVDIYKGKINKNATEKQVGMTMRILCLIFVAISLVLAILNEKYKLAAIAYLMGISWGTLSGCFFGPFVIGLMWKKVTKSSVWASVIGTLVLTVGLILLLGFHQNAFDCSIGTAIQSGIGCSPLIGVICMIYSVIITFVVSLFTKKPNEEVITEAFDKHFEGEII